MVKDILVEHGCRYYLWVGNPNVTTALSDREEFKTLYLAPNNVIGLFGYEP
jgi:hypothetical protein